MKATSEIQVSVIIPVKDEAESIPILAREVTAAFEATPWTWECLWVDDGSQDGTPALLESLHARDTRQQYMILDRNYGQSAALAAAFRNARGSILATLDGDLQNDPADLPILIGLLKRGEVDMVNGRRAQRCDSWLRRLSSRIANAFRKAMTQDPVSDVGCATRAFFRDCVQGLFVFRGMHRFLPTLVAMNGFKTIEQPVHHRPRRLGTSKYGVWNRLFVGLWDTLAVHWMLQRRVKATAQRSSLILENDETRTKPVESAAKTVAASRE